LVALRVAVRRREIWVVGANLWRNPGDDLLADFEDNRDVRYAALGQPQNEGRAAPPAAAGPVRRPGQHARGPAEAGERHLAVRDEVTALRRFTRGGPEHPTYWRSKSWAGRSPAG
jgi:hypothetical protein